ncbi:MAG: hypothetical protein ACREJQ_08710 [bacterium]
MGESGVSTVCPSPALGLRGFAVPCCWTSVVTWPAVSISIPAVAAIANVNRSPAHLETVGRRDYHAATPSAPAANCK